MTWSERRTVTILSVILAILFAALLVVLGIRHRENLAAAESGTVQVPPGEDPVQFLYTSLTYDNGSTTLSFSRDEAGVWVWSDDPNFPLDDTTISAIVQNLSNWAPQQTITDEAVLTNCGMEDPAASFTATTTNGFVSLLFGKTTTDGASRYVRLNGDETTVYILDNALYDLLCVPIYDMCLLPELPQLKEEAMDKVVIRGAETEEGVFISTVLAAQRPDGEDTATTWRCSGANVTDDATVRALMEDLQALAFEKCIVYRPSEEAVSLCGFDNPTTLIVDYFTDTGVEETLTLEIGNPLPDSSGRYVQRADDTTIYFLPTAALDPLMRISVTGLEG